MDPPGKSLAGVPQTLDGWWDLARRLRARRERPVRSLLDQGRHEERVTRALGHRWPWRDPHGAEPTPYMPTDVLAVRTLAALGDLGQALDDPPPPYAGALASLVLDGVPHWLGADAARGITASEPPERAMLEDLRLPWDTCAVWFGAPARLGTVAEVMGDRVRVEAGIGTDHEARLDHVPWELALCPLLLSHPDDVPPDRAEVLVEGVVLLSGAEGHRSDLCAWVVAVHLPPSEVRSRPTRCILPARRSESELGHVLDGLAAVVAWGSWIGRGRDLPLASVDRRSLRAWARRVDVTEVGPVRVLATPTRQARPRDEPVSTHASPVTHLRRGHWRRQWHADGHRPTWIAPTLVNPGGPADEQVTVWRLPRR